MTTPSPSQARILIVDDEPLNIKVLVDLLRPNYNLLVAKNGEQALERMSMTPPPDLVLLDVMMPGMDGYEVCRHLKQNPHTATVPVIFCSAMGESEDETRGFECGAVDYITKPISPMVVKARVRTHLQLRQAREELQVYNRELESKVEERTQDVQRVQDVTIRALASLAETRDNETGNHVRRTQHYVRLLAERLRDHPRFAADLNDTTIALLFKSAPLHDVGKVGIPDAILLKPGRLDGEEFAIMKTHAELGRKALLAATLDENGQRIIPDDNEAGSFLRYACDIAGSHHEKWDGSGYPEGLKGEDIPLSARLMAVADVYDALICKRVYKPAFPHEEAVDIIVKGRGSHFDPDICDAFIEAGEAFQAIAQRFSDQDEHEG
jgi:putative two-component system response regulator